MSEYQERHAVSRLVGAPPGYVGYEESGQLTEAIRRKPYAVVLLDEIEKAHPYVFNILLQVLDDGRLTDNKGRTVDFKNTVLIMTSNIGSMVIQQKLSGLTEANADRLFDETREAVMDALKTHLRPEFINRIDDIIMFKPLTRDEIMEVVSLQFKQLKKMMTDNGLRVEISESALRWLADAGYDPNYGARPIKRVMQKQLMNQLSKLILSGQIDGSRPIIIEKEGQGLTFKN